MPPYLTLRPSLATMIIEGLTAIAQVLASRQSTSRLGTAMNKQLRSAFKIQGVKVWPNSFLGLGR